MLWELGMWHCFEPKPAPRSPISAGSTSRGPKSALQTPKGGRIGAAGRSRLACRLLRTLQCRAWLGPCAHARQAIGDAKISVAEHIMNPR